MTPYYDHAGITIYHGDCFAVLPELAAGSVDLLLADPNYGTTQLEWDKPLDWARLWPLLNRVCTRRALQVVFSAQPFTTDLITSNRKHYRYELIWAKTMPVGFLDANRRPLRAHENILVFCRALGQSTYNPQKTGCKPEREHRQPYRAKEAAHYGSTQLTLRNDIITERYPTDVLTFSNGHGGQSEHETAKPLALMRWLIASYSQPGDLILDPGMGRGTTLRAAKDLGRRAIGIELRESCCEQAVKWLQQEVLPLEAIA